MSEPAEQHIISLLWSLFRQLQRRQFLLGIDDFLALRQALKAGFGWSSPQALCDLCSALWAKSLKDQEIIDNLFAQILAPALGDWQLPPDQPYFALKDPALLDDQSLQPPDAPPQPPLEEPAAMAGTRSLRNLPPIYIDKDLIDKRPLILVPQFPVSYREVAQTWRHLRRPVRQGPATELDIDATIQRYGRQGIISQVVLVPRRRNTMRLLLLIDRQGSMTPFHHFCDEITAAILHSGRFNHIARYYFHDVPVEGADVSVLEQLPRGLFPDFDKIVPDIPPLTAGTIYADPELLSLRQLPAVLEEYASGAAVVLISDAGAMRGCYDKLRILDTLAFLKGLRQYTQHYVWLNPLPTSYWQNSATHKVNNTATQLARYIPMFPLDREGMYRAVNILRGQPYTLERLL